MCHIFFIDSLVEEHLDCFQVLATMSNELIKFPHGMIMYPLGICPKLVSLGHEID